MVQVCRLVGMTTTASAGRVRGDRVVQSSRGPGLVRARVAVFIRDGWKTVVHCVLWGKVRVMMPRLCTVAVRLCKDTVWQSSNAVMVYDCSCVGPWSRPVADLA